VENPDSTASPRRRGPSHDQGDGRDSTRRPRIRSTGWPPSASPEADRMTSISALGPR